MNLLQMKNHLKAYNLQHLGVMRFTELQTMYETQCGLGGYI